MAAFPQTNAFLVLVVALIGTTITPYMQFYVASAVVDKGITPADYREGADRHRQRCDLERRHQHLHHHRHSCGHRRDRALQTAQEAAKALTPVVGPAAPYLFAAGLLGASLLAASVVPLSTSYAIADAVGAPRSVSNSFRQAPLFYALFTLQILVGAGVALAPGNLVALVVNAQVLNGIITPILLIYVLILANRRSVLGSAANGRVFRVVATACIGVVAILSFAVLVNTVTGLG